MTQADGIRWPATLPGGGQPILQGGIKYRVTYRVGQQKRDREAVMTFLGIRSDHGSNTSLWSARPVAGTQELPVEAVSRIDEAPPGSQIYLNRVVK